MKIVAADLLFSYLARPHGEQPVFHAGGGQIQMKTVAAVLLFSYLARPLVSSLSSRLASARFR
jgi:hypothetical protein